MATFDSSQQRLPCCLRYDLFIGHSTPPVRFPSCPASVKYLGAWSARSYLVALSCFIRRDLRRAALFRRITPFLAARSSSLTAARIASSVDSELASEAIA